MQQVGKSAFLAGASTVDPRLLPVPARSRARRVQIGARRLRVLHGARILRALMVLFACGTLFLVYQMRETLGELAGAGFAAIEAELAGAGFSVGEIRISGQVLTSETAILAALGLEPNLTTFGLDAAAARARIAALPAIESATVRKIYPAEIVVDIIERVPVARWRVDGVTFLIDAQGRAIGQDGGAYADLPLVIGDGAAEAASAMIRALESYPALMEDIVAISRIADRRWDLIYDTGLRVQLPEAGVAQALRRLSTYQRDYRLLDRNVAVIDLRVPHLVALRPEPNQDQTAR